MLFSLINVIIVDNFNKQTQEQTMPLQDYTMIGKIGHGKYSSVYKIKRKVDSHLLALKKVQLNKLQERSKKNAFSQQKMLKELKHPNIISLIESHYDEQFESLYLILQLSQFGDLQMKIHDSKNKGLRIQEEEIWNIISDISNGLSYLHSKNIMHRDIKPSNILIFANKLYKIADLNISKVSNYLNYTRTGTLSYVCPQIWKGESYDVKSDIWSFGCMIYELMCLKKPFFSQDMNQMYKKVTKCHFISINDNYSKELKNLVSSMMQLNPKIRPSAQNIYKTSLRHIQKHQTPLLFKRSQNYTPFTINKKQKQLKLDDLKYEKTCEIIKKSKSYLCQSQKLKISNRRHLILKTRLQQLQKSKQSIIPTINTQTNQDIRPDQIDIYNKIKNKVIRNRFLKIKGSNNNNNKIIQIIHK